MLKPHFRICLAAFFIDFSAMVTMTVLPFYVYNQIGGGAAMSGIIGGTRAAAYGFICLVSAGFVSRAKKSLTWAICGVAAFAVFSCAMLLSRDPYVCGIVATLAVAGLAFVWPALHSWVGGEPDPKQRARGMSWFNIAWSSGFAVSPLIAGPLYDYDYRLPFLLLFVVCALTLLLIKSLPDEKEYFGTVSAQVREAHTDHDRASEAVLYAAWCAALMGSLLANVTRTVYPKHIDELVAAGELRFFFERTPLPILTAHAATKYSWLAFALGLATALSFLVLGRTHRWQHKFQVLLWLQVGTAAAFWVLANARSLAVMMACFVVAGAFAGVSFFSGVYYGMADPAHKHRRSAINEGAVGVGAFGGSIVFGYLAGRYGMSMPFHFAPILVAVGVLVQLALLRYGAEKSRRKNGAPDAARL